MDRESLAGAHQINAHVLAGSHEIAQRLLLDGRYPDRVQRIDHQQPQHPLSVTLVSLDLVLRRALDLPRRRHHTPNARRLQLPGEPIPRRPRLVRHPRRTGQLRQELHHLRGLTRQPARTNLAGAASSVTASTLRACTSRPAQLQTLLVMVGSSICGCGRRAGGSPRGLQTPTTVVGGRPWLTTTAGRHPPYGLRRRALSRACTTHATVQR